MPPSTDQLHHTIPSLLQLYDLYVSVRKAVRRHRFAPVVSFDTRLCAN